MRAARLHEYGKPLILEDVPTPTPIAEQVVVRIDGSGFCRSDVHIIEGEIRVLPKLPLILGHENAGRVAAIGAGVRAVREGDAVAVYGGWGCGLCDACVVGAEQICSKPQWCGLSNWDGGYAEYLLVPHEKYLIKLGKLEPKAAAPLTDAALTPYRAVRKARRFLSPDRPVLSIGVGGLGQYGIEFLRLLSGAPVIAVDTSSQKREIAKSLGAAWTFDGKDPDLLKKILDLTHGEGVSAAFDYVGSDSTLALAVGATASLGKVSQIGLAGGTAKLQVLVNARFEVQFEATLWGTIKELREVVALAESGRLAPIATEYVRLGSIHRAFERVKEGDVEGRLVVTP